MQPTTTDLLQIIRRQQSPTEQALTDRLISLSTKTIVTTSTVCELLVLNALIGMIGNLPEGDTDGQA